jgi:hypothetical protein
LHELPGPFAPASHGAQVPSIRIEEVEPGVLAIQHKPSTRNLMRGPRYPEELVGFGSSESDHLLKGERANLCIQIAGGWDLALQLDRATERRGRQNERGDSRQPNAT